MFYAFLDLQRSTGPPWMPALWPSTSVCGNKHLPSSWSPTCGWTITLVWKQSWKSSSYFTESVFSCGCHTYIHNTQLLYRSKSEICCGWGRGVGSIWCPALVLHCRCSNIHLKNNNNNITHTMWYNLMQFKIHYELLDHLV